MFDRLQPSMEFDEVLLCTGRPNKSVLALVATIILLVKDAGEATTTAMYSIDRRLHEEEYEEGRKMRRVGGLAWKNEQGEFFFLHVIYAVKFKATPRTPHKFTSSSNLQIQTPLQLWCCPFPHTLLQY